MESNLLAVDKKDTSWLFQDATWFLSPLVFRCDHEEWLTFPTYLTRKSENENQVKAEVTPYGILLT